MKLTISWNEKEKKAEELVKTLEYHLNRVLYHYEIEVERKKVAEVIDKRKVMPEQEIPIEETKKSKKEMEEDAKEITEQEVNPEDLIPDKLDAIPNLEAKNE